MTMERGTEMKKKSRSLNTRIWSATVASFLLLLLGGTASAQWSGPDANNNIYYNAGKVGIGTTTPSFKLHIIGGSDNQLKLDNDGSTYTSLYWANSGTIKGQAYYNVSSNQFRLGGSGTNTVTVFTSNTDVERMRIDASGNVGIGTTTSGAKLEVNGASIFAGTVNSAVGSGVIFNVPQIYGNSAYFHIGSAATDMFWGQESSSGGSLFGGTLGNASVFGNRDNVPLQLVTTNVPRLTILGSSGNVGIGTTAPQSTLQVNGYLQLALTSGAPPAVDCDNATEYGRMKVDATGNKLYVCTSTGWKSTTLAP